MLFVAGLTLSLAAVWQITQSSRDNPAPFILFAMGLVLMLVWVFS